MDFIYSLVYPLELAVAWIMVKFHAVFTALGMPADSGWTWSLSIIGLVIVIRIILIPLFFKQIKASRGLQLIQPQVQAIQKKYKGKTDPDSRQAMTKETMELYRETGTNPFASCLPILMQGPVFFALFRVLNEYVAKSQSIGILSQDLAEQARDSTIFGAPLSSSFLRADAGSTQIITVVLIILMCATSFTTQRQLMMKNMPASALDNPFARQQKVMLYVLPVIFAISGVNFPIGVLLYWLTTNIWSMGQQFYVIRRMPAPGSEAEKAFLARKQKRSGADGAAVADVSAPPAIVSGQRVQPKRKSRAKGGSAKVEPEPGPSTTDEVDSAP
jgi:YidC/Oxa1 family membrane protein insertase